MQLQRKKYILMPPALTFLMSKFIHQLLFRFKTMLIVCHCTFLLMNFSFHLCSALTASLQIFVEVLVLLYLHSQFCPLVYAKTFQRFFVHFPQAYSSVLCSLGFRHSALLMLHKNKLQRLILVKEGNSVTELPCQQLPCAV